MGKRDFIPVFNRVEDRQDLKKIIEFIASDDEKSKVALRDGSSIDYLPTNKMRLRVDSAQVMRTGTVQPEDADKIVSVIEWDLSQRGIGKNDLMILDLIANNNWERPIYFTSIMHQNINGLQNYFQLEGLTYRFVPIKTESSSGRVLSHINSEMLYDRFMNVYSWGQMDDPDTWVDYYTRRTAMILRIRYNHTLLAQKLISEGKNDKAEAVLDRIVQIMPKEQFPYEIFAASIAEAYYECGLPDKANNLLNSYLEDVYQDLDYYLSIQRTEGNVLRDEANRSARILEEIMGLTRQFNQTELADSIEAKINQLVAQGS